MEQPLGLDIGGANLKAALRDGTARSRPFALWQQPEGLADALRQLMGEMPGHDGLAVTMTGELCDCFESKAQGVAAILSAVTEATRHPVQVWQTTGRFVDVATARGQPLQTAAANWLALAVFAGRLAPAGPALLLDVGSTTTDIIPLQDGRPMPWGRTDPERLRTGELVYTGVRRTPLCALLGPGYAAELFATALDAYLVLERLAEDERDCGTADGRPAIRAAAQRRLARMRAADLETSSAAERLEMARRAHEQQQRLIQEGIERVSRGLNGPPLAMILAGEGEFLARDLLQTYPGRIISLNEMLGAEASRAACAYALAVLASEDHD